MPIVLHPSLHPHGDWLRIHYVFRGADSEYMAVAAALEAGRATADAGLRA
jgi:hypothetical protein